jgi:molybdenum cofactor cytidylyltransferase
MDKDQKPKSKDRLSAILLAAGRSKRMGAFKPLLPFGEKTVIQSCIDYLRHAGLQTIVVVVGHRATDIRATVQEPSIRIVENPDPDSEMGQSVARGVEALPADTSAVVIGLVDQPAVSTRVVHSIIEEWKSGSRLIVPTWQDNGGHPVLIDMHFRGELLNLPNTGGLKSLFITHAADVRRLPVDCPFIARDMDTWDDYSRLYWDVFGQPPPADRESNERP